MATEPYQRADTPHVAEQRTAVEARQGVISGRVFLVLVTSVILAVIAMVVGWYIMR
jgi:hypothetical protein